MELDQQEPVDLRQLLQSQYNQAVLNSNTWEAKNVLKRAYGRVVIDLDAVSIPKTILWEYERHET